MPDWRALSSELESLLRLKTRPIAFRRLERALDLEEIEGISKIDHPFTFCQIPFQARVLGRTVGATRQDGMLDRCMRLHGLKTASEKSMRSEAASLATTWFGSFEDALRQQGDTPRVPAGEAIVIGPLAKACFEPEVVLIYGNPAQAMFLLCGLQKERYERFQFHFSGEGSCADALGQCYATGKPSVGLPCYGERAFGQVADDEIVVAVPPKDIGPAISGLKTLAGIGLRYPIPSIGGRSDVMPVLSELYPQDFKG